MPDIAIGHCEQPLMPDIFGEQLSFAPYFHWPIRLLSIFRYAILPLSRRHFFLSMLMLFTPDDADFSWRCCALRYYSAIERRFMLRAVSSTPHFTIFADVFAAITPPYFTTDYLLIFHGAAFHYC